MTISQDQIIGGVLSLLVALVAAFIIWAVNNSKESGGSIIARFKVRPDPREKDKLHIRLNIPHLQPLPSERQCRNNTEFIIVKRGKPKSLARCTLCTQEFYVTWKDEEWVLAK